MAPRLSQGSAVERRIGFDLVGCLGRALQEGEHLVRIGVRVRVGVQVRVRVRVRSPGGRAP